MTRAAARTLYLVKRAETAGRTGLEHALQELQVTPSQYTTMALLESQHDQSSADLARKAGITPQSTSETIASLERKGLIVRAENPEHRRILTISLTDEGRRLLKRCDTLVDSLERALLTGFSDKEIETLRNALQLIAQNGANLS